MNASSHSVIDQVLLVHLLRPKGPLFMLYLMDVLNARIYSQFKNAGALAKESWAAGQLKTRTSDDYHLAFILVYTPSWLSDRDLLPRLSIAYVEFL